MRSIIITAILLTACDPSADECPSTELLLAGPDSVEPAAVSLREQAYNGLYTDRLSDKPIYRKQFVALINACQKQPDPPLTCTLSWYQPDPTRDERVLGIGCSMVAQSSLLDCWASLWLANDAVAF